MRQMIIIFIGILLSVPTFADLNNDLFEAVKKGDIEQVKSLIDKGADVNITDTNGETPLHVTSYWGCKEGAKLLIDKGVD